MRRLLCIFFLFCLILGAALPAAAEGEDEPVPCTNENCILATDHAGDCVTVPAVEATDAAALSGLLGSKETLLTDLIARYPRLNTSGDLTVQLPAAAYDAPVTCGVDLDGGTLTLKGAPDKGTKLTALIVNSARLGVNGIDFQNSSTGYAFRLTQKDGAVPILTLTGNTFASNRVVSLLDADGGAIGTWLAAGTAGTAEINFNASVTPDGEDAMIIRFDQEKSVLTGWNFNFITSCTYKNAFAIYNSEVLSDSNFVLQTDKQQIKMIALHSGEYIVVNDKAPVVTKKDASTLTIEISELQNKYLDEITIDCSFPGAAVTNGKGAKVYSSLDSNKKLTFKVDSAGTYTIKEVENTTTQTKTVTKYYTISTKDVYPIYHVNFLKAMKTATAEEGVKLNCTEAGKRPISIPVESLEAAAEKGLSVTLDAKSYILQLDAAAMKSLAQQAKGDRVQLKYQSLNHKTLSDEGLAAVSSHLAQYPGHSADLAFLVTAVSDNETIVDLQNGTIRLDIPFIVLPGTEDDTNTVYALLSGGVSEARDTEVADGRLRATLTDLTEYMVFLEGPEPETVPETTEETVEETTVETTAETTEAATQPMEPEEPEKSGWNPLLWIPIVLVLLSGGAAAWFLFFRKRLKK